jgi:signal transduction histidine kinase
MLPYVWPHSLASRTTLVLVVALALVQAAGLWIHALDRVDLQRLAQERNMGIRIGSLYRSIATSPPEDRAALLTELDPTYGVHATLSDQPLTGAGEPAPFGLQQMFQLNMAFVPLPPEDRWRDFLIWGLPGDPYISISMLLPDGQWLDMRLAWERSQWWYSPTFLAAFLLMTVAAAVLIILGARRLVAPIATLAAAADALGRDVNAPPMAENGPTEIARAAHAFNTMAGRIRRFVADRTFLLTAIGHDLRTPITRMKLRAEFVEDDELRETLLRDLDELEAMVTATLAFGRDVAGGEAPVKLDLAELLQTILDEATDMNPELAEQITYKGPDHYTFQGRLIALKRALSNLIGNAIAYGDGVEATLVPPGGGNVQIILRDFGPGVPEDQRERLFEPFFRMEESRNRQTGGIGLGLPIARNVVRAHGGDVTLANHKDGGLVVTVTLPA